CGGTSRTPASPPETNGPAATSPAATSAGLKADPDHTYRVVNLHLYNSAPGAALDVYPATASDLQELPNLPAPLVTGLGYGQATDALPPGAVPTALGNLRYGLSVRPHDASQAGAANLTFDVNDSNDGGAWQRGVVVLGGTGNGLNSTA